MIKEKTRGNLSEYEEKFLTETLTQLKITYAQEADKKQKDKNNSKATERENNK